MSAAVAHAAPGAAAARPRAAARAAAGARPRAGGGLRIRVPLRLVVGVQYSDAALAVYIKIAALALRTEGCTARVETLAEYLDMSKSAVERALRQLARPDDVDGITEVLTTRRTKRGGQGDSAHRVVRQAEDDELFVWLPARAATSLPPRLLRLYALISYAQTRRQPLAYSDMGGVLVHQGGRSAGEPLGDRQIARLVDELAATGWATVREREGLQGRHAYEAHLRPLHTVPASPDIHDGSGPDDHDGSLSEEDPRTDRLKTSATGGGGIRRRRLPVVARGPVDNRAPDTFRPAGGQGTNGAKGGSSGDGSGPTLSARTWSVLEPVRHLLDDARPFVIRRIETEISRQLAAGAGMRRITERLQRRYATTDRVRDGGRWILGAGLPRHGCGLDVCEDGVLWHTGQACQVCLDIALAAQPAAAALEEQPPPPAPAAPDPITLPPPPTGTAVPELTRAQRQALRETATPDSIRAAIDTYGRAAAGRIYGLQRVAQELNRLDGYGPEGDDHAD
jgi:hypothetical protein